MVVTWFSIFPHRSIKAEQLDAKPKPTSHIYTKLADKVSPRTPEYKGVYEQVLPRDALVVSHRYGHFANSTWKILKMISYSGNLILTKKPHYK